MVTLGPVEVVLTFLGLIFSVLSSFVAGAQWMRRRVQATPRWKRAGSYPK